MRRGQSLAVVRRRRYNVRRPAASDEAPRRGKDPEPGRMVMNVFEAIVYGVVQGLTEFIPVSSNAHLEVTSVALTGRDIGAAFTAVIQWGTWVACVIYFRHDIGRLARAFFHGIWKNRPFATHDARLAWMLLVATVPIGVVGILLKKWIEHELRWLYVIAAAEALFAAVLAVAEWVHRWRVRMKRPLKDLGAVGWGEALLVGFAQCFALIPGASRSGTTITGGIFGGMTRETAARFSFLLSLPSVFAAGLYELYKEKEKLLGSQQDVLNLVVATVVAGLVGYASIAFLIRFLKSHSTWVFIGYRVIADALLAVLIWRGVLPNEPLKAAGESEAGAGGQRDEENAKMSRTFPAAARLSYMGARAVPPSAEFLKSAVTNDEQNGIFPIGEVPPTRKVRPEKSEDNETLTDQRPPAGPSWPASPFPLDRRRSVMAVFTLRTLVLRGVAVVRDGVNVGLRLGVESQPAGQTTEVRINPRHPRNQKRSDTPAQRPDDHAEYDRVAASAAAGAGRSLRCDGVLSRRGAARIASPAIPLGWRQPQGSSQSPAAKRLSTADERSAVENAAALARPLPPGASAFTAEGRTAVRSARRMPAGWTRSASTWAS